MSKGITLKALRTRMGLKQAEVAARIPKASRDGYLSDTALSRIEGGDFEPPAGFVWDYLAACIDEFDAQAAAKKAEVAHASA